MEPSPIVTDTARQGFRKPRQLSTFPYIIAAESTRHGGTSTIPYASMNLGLYTQDKVESVAENRRLFFNRLGIEPRATAGSYQVHGDEVLLVEKPGQYEGFDALITQRPGLFLTVTIADCVPILLLDTVNRVVAAIHAGWRGTIAQIAAKTLQEMSRAFGTKGSDCCAYIGTCIDECSFEVDTDVADHFSNPYKRWEEEKQKFFIDLKACNKAILKKEGIPDSRIEVSPYSTVLNNADYFSYRKEKGVTGRMLGMIGLKG